jgi:hypothetical protein
MAFTDEQRRRERARYAERVARLRAGLVEPSFKPPPAHVMAERDRAYAVEPTPNMIVLGDPLPGRSALERFKQMTPGPSYNQSGIRANFAP